MAQKLFLTRLVATQLCFHGLRKIRGKVPSGKVVPLILCTFLHFTYTRSMKFEKLAEIRMASRLQVTQQSNQVTRGSSAHATTLRYGLIDHPLRDLWGEFL